METKNIPGTLIVFRIVLHSDTSQRGKILNWQNGIGINVQLGTHVLNDVFSPFRKRKHPWNSDNCQNWASNTLFLTVKYRNHWHLLPDKFKIMKLFFNFTFQHRSSKLTDEWSWTNRWHGCKSHSWDWPTIVLVRLWHFKSGQLFGDCF